ncbi:hypothetical protein [Breznakiella homolactica]|uniref:Uncharacterized protein n=1 Tax=Breznakiella homolactica TaxID=2798577 RepID=A0A7T7XQL2_9SPIR|nr:hypothetical protein [Breznakiella homolactica]QQO10675.1 hypothetical protein JFL75_07090 [Breznakiella homolactica]
MKRRYMFGLFSVILLAAAMVSCKSSGDVVEPEPVVEAPPEQTTQPTGVDQNLLNNMEAARAKAEAARQQSIDYEGDVYFPDDWNTAESQYTSAGGANRNDANAVTEAIRQYNAAAAAFDDITAWALPLYAAALRDDVMAARRDALNAGAMEFSPDRFYLADEKGEAAYLKFDAADYYGAIDAGEEALVYYIALKTGSDAFVVREAIMDHNFVRYDRNNFDLAENSGMDALDEYDAGNIEVALDSAEEALFRYRLVWRTAWQAVAGEQRDAASAERKAALDIKANVAVRHEFELADSVFTQGAAAYNTEEFEEAAGLYSRSESMFAIVWEAANYKRQMAEDAIRAAEEKVAESDETAREAELILEGGAE